MGRLTARTNYDHLFESGFSPLKIMKAKLKENAMYTQQGAEKRGMTLQEQVDAIVEGLEQVKLSRSIPTEIRAEPDTLAGMLDRLRELVVVDEPSDTTKFMGLPLIEDPGIAAGHAEIRDQHGKVLRTVDLR